MLAVGRLYDLDEEVWRPWVADTAAGAAEAAVAAVAAESAGVTGAAEAAAAAAAEVAAEAAGVGWEVRRRWAAELDAALPDEAVEAAIAHALRRRRRRARPSALLRSLGGAAYFGACWAWGGRRRGRGSRAASAPR